MKKFFILVFCCFWAIISIAQNNKKFNEWKQKAIAKGSSWNNFTREASAAHNHTYFSLYVDRQFVASFANRHDCDTKELELYRLAEQIFNSNTDKKSNSYQGSAKAREGLHKFGGMSYAEIDQMRKQIEGKRDEAINKQRAEENKKLLADVKKSCDCRPETNQNYNPDAKPYDFGNNDLFKKDDSPDNNLNTMLFGDGQTQYDNVFDALAAAPTHTPASSGVPVNIDFSDMEKFVPKGSDEIYVGDGNNFKGVIPQPPIYLGEESNKERREQYFESLKNSDEQSPDEQLELLRDARSRLEEELADIKEQCHNELYCITFKSKPIREQLDVLEKRIEGRNEWLEHVKNMSPETLEAQERNYKKLAEMAELANCSYFGREIPDGWNKCIDFSCIDQANIDGAKSSFRCELLYNEDTKKYVLSFRGTDDIEDVLHSWGQGNVSKSNQQTALALKVTKEILEELRNKGIESKDLQLAGHSLGGRLAAEAAIENKLMAYTFNSADVSLETRVNLGPSGYGNIINTVSANDILTASTFGLGSPKGGINYNYSSDTYSPGHTSVIKEAYGNSKLDAHDMYFLLDSIKQRRNDIVNQRSKQK